MNPSYAAMLTAALLLALLLTPAVRRAALACGAVDLPGGRKQHLGPVPRWGGIAVGLAAALSVTGALLLEPGLRPAVAGRLGGARWTALGSAAAAVFFLGAIDDVKGVSARLKFACELVAASVVVIVVGPPRAIDLSPLAGPVELGVLGIVLAVLWIVTLTNAVNLIDGMDGAAAGSGAISALALALMSLTLGNAVATVTLLALAGALIGFIPYNLRSSKTFLGDSGSLSVGFVLGAGSLVGLQRDGGWMAIPALLALAIPLGECTLTVVRRSLGALQLEHMHDDPVERYVLRSSWPRLFRADRRHIHHRLLDLGMSRERALTLLYGASVMLAVLGVVAVRWPILGPFSVLLAAAGAIYFAPRWLYDELRLLRRGALLPLYDVRWASNRLVHAGYDAAATATSFVLAEALAHGVGVLRDPGLALRTGAVVVVMLFGLWLAGLYRIALRHAGLTETLRASRAVVMGSVLSAAAIAALFQHDLRAAVWGLFLFFMLSAVVPMRMSFRLFDHAHQRGRNGGRPALIFGAGRAGKLALHEMLSNPRLGLVPVGFVDDDVGKWGREFKGYRIYPSVGLDSLCKALGVADVVLSTRKLPEDREAELMWACGWAGFRVLRFGVSWEEGNGHAGNGGGRAEAPARLTVQAAPGG
jgi:UDP-GlcNAc:undecaprenyl-phosphate GlcNAc-1-phosphate transferase